MQRPTLFEWVFYIYLYVPQKDESSAFIFFRTLDSSEQNRRQREKLSFFFSLKRALAK